MTRTSTEARFRRAFAGLVVALVVLCGVFLTIGYLQGPRLSSAQVDAKAVIGQPDQQLRLFANQPIARVAAAQVSVSPHVATTVTTSGTVVAVQFGARLEYDTEYTVTVRDVTSIYQSQPGTLSYTFKTGSPDLYYLQRGTPEDQVVRTTVGGTQHTAVYSAVGIQDFAVSNGVLAVATLGADNASSLSLVSLTDGAVETVALPGRGVVQKLASAASGTLVGFEFTSAADGATPTYSSTLFSLNLDGTHVVKPVTGLDGQPLRVLDWEFMPDSSGLLALSRDSSLFLIDPLTPGAVSPLGQFTGLGPVSRDGTVVTMTDAFGTAALTIADGSQQRLAVSPLENDSSLAYLGPVETLSGGLRVEKLVIAGAGGVHFGSAIAVDDGKTARVIYRTPNDAGSIESFEVSPNCQYVALRVVPDVSNSVSDGYAYDAASSTTETIIVDLTGKMVRTIAGFALAWD